jgi:hypothetical protein
MKRRSFALALAPLLAPFLLPGCGWGRFDDVLEDPPVVLVDRPDIVSGTFGLTLAGNPATGGSLLAGGQAIASSAALFRLGAAEDPSTTPVGRACQDAGRCRAVGQPVGLPDQGANTGCFVAGVGQGEEGLASEHGLLVSCIEGGEIKLPAPAAFAKGVAPKLFETIASFSFRDVLALGFGGGRLAAASPDAKLAWMYGPSGQVEAEIPAPMEADDSFGSSVTVTGSPDAPIVAVGAVASGTVYFFDAGPGGVALRGCAKKPGAWGSALHAIDDGDRHLLAVSDKAGRVDVLDPTLISGPCGPPSSDAIVFGPACSEDDDVSGCGGGSFGAAMASGDLDGDGDLELVVSAPAMKVRDDGDSGGVIFVFDLEGGNTAAYKLFLSSAKSADHLGVALATVRLGPRDVVVAGVPGPSAQKVAIFLCSGLGGAGRTAGRCE